MDGVNLMGFTTNTSRRQLQGLGARGISRALGTLAVLAGLSTLAPAVAEAQRATQAKVNHLDEMLPDGTIRQIPIPATNGFDLFAAEDLAFGTLRMSGTYRAAIRTILFRLPDRNRLRDERWRALCRRRDRPANK